MKRDKAISMFAAVGLAMVVPVSHASVTNCGSLASDYAVTNLTDEGAGAADNENVFTYQFVPTSEYTGNVVVFVGGKKVTSITGTYQVIPDRLFSEAATTARGQIGIVLASTITGYCGGQEPCTLIITASPVCGTLGNVQEIVGSRNILVPPGNPPNPISIVAIGPIVWDAAGL